VRPVCLRFQGSMRHIQRTRKRSGVTSSSFILLVKPSAGSFYSIPASAVNALLFAEASGGGGGNRTRVRKGSYGSFYTLSRLGVYLAGRPLSGKQSIGQPVNLARRLRASPPDHPELTSPRQVASGEPPERRRGLIKPRELAVCCQLFNFHRINEVMALGVLLPPLPSRRIQFAPRRSLVSGGSRTKLATCRLSVKSTPERLTSRWPDPRVRLG